VVGMLDQCYGKSLRYEARDQPLDQCRLATA
jgi:hypothetical protein